MNNGVKEIKWGAQTLAIVVSSRWQSPGVTFFTEASEDQQFAYIQRKKGERVEAHTHRRQERVVSRTQEVLVVRKGRLRLWVYSDERLLIDTLVLETGDAVVLLGGGHAILFEDDTELYECKVGCYMGPSDKIPYEERKHVQGPTDKVAYEDWTDADTEYYSRLDG